MTTTSNLLITKIDLATDQQGVTANEAFDKLDQAAAQRGAISIAGGAGTQALTAAQQLNAILEFTGAITGNRSITVDMQKQWIVFNNTTGAFTVTLLKAAATGIVIGTGKRCVAYLDATDVRRVSPDT